MFEYTLNSDIFRISLIFYASSVYGIVDCLKCYTFPLICYSHYYFFYTWIRYPSIYRHATKYYIIICTYIVRQKPSILWFPSCQKFPSEWILLRSVWFWQSSDCMYVYSRNGLEWSLKSADCISIIFANGFCIWTYIHVWLSFCVQLKFWYLIFSLQLIGCTKNDFFLVYF